MFDFLSEILSKTDLSMLQEIIEFSLDTDIDLKDIQRKIAFANFYQSKLLKLLLKMRLAHADLETEFEAWNSKEIHNIAQDYDGSPDLLKNQKDYERELKAKVEHIETSKILKKLEQTIKSLESKEKELSQFDWKVKGILDIHKIEHNLLY